MVHPHIGWPSGLDFKLTAIAICLVLPVILALVIKLALITRSRYLANVSLLESFHPIANLLGEYPLSTSFADEVNLFHRTASLS